MASKCAIPQFVISLLSSFESGVAKNNAEYSSLALGLWCWAKTKFTSFWRRVGAVLIAFISKTALKNMPFK